MFMCIHVLQSSNFACHTIHFADGMQISVEALVVVGTLKRFNIIFNQLGK